MGIEQHIENPCVHFPNRVYAWDLIETLYMATCAYCRTDYHIERELYESFRKLIGENTLLFPIKRIDDKPLSLLLPESYKHELP